MAKVAIFPNKNSRVMQYPIASGQTFREGAAVLLVAGELTECGADPAIILGFALHAAGEGPDTTNCLVAVAKSDTTFFAEGDANPVAADIGVAYGIAKDGDGDWYLDGTDTVATRLKVEDVDVTRNLYEFNVLAANRQLG